MRAPINLFVCVTIPLLHVLACGPNEDEIQNENNDIVIIELEDMAPVQDMRILDMTSDNADMSRPDMPREPMEDMRAEQDMTDMTDMAPDMVEDMAPDMTTSKPVCGPMACDQIVWSQGSALPVARDHHMTFLFGDEATGDAMLFVAGGFLQGSPPTFVDAVVGSRVQADGSLQAWEEQPSLPAALAGTPVIQRGQTVVLPGGRITDAQGLSLSKKVWANTLSVDGLQGPWRELPDMPVNRFHHASAQSGSYVYLTGGLEINDATNTVYFARFDANDEPGVWSATTPMPEPKTHHGSFAHGGYIYVTGGMNTGVRNPNIVSTIWRAPLQFLSSGLGAWERYGDFPEPVSTHAHTIYEGYVYSFGGITGSGFSDHVWRAPLLENGEIGNWEELGDAIMPRTVGHTHHVPIWRDNVYVTSGGQRLTLTSEVSVGELNAQR